MLLAEKTKRSGHTNHPHYTIASEDVSFLSLGEEVSLLLQSQIGLSPRRIPYIIADEERYKTRSALAPFF